MHNNSYRMWPVQSRWAVPMWIKREDRIRMIDTGRLSHQEIRNKKSIDWLAQTLKNTLHVLMLILKQFLLTSFLLISFNFLSSKVVLLSTLTVFLINLTIMSMTGSLVILPTDRCNSDANLFTSFWSRTLRPSSRLSSPLPSCNRPIDVNSFKVSSKCLLVRLLIDSRSVQRC